MTHLSVVVPLFNEERCIEENFGILRDYLETLGREWEVILVDDGSTDRTPSIVRCILGGEPRVRAVFGRRNRGKGHAVRSGILSARGKFVLFMDADLAVPVAFLQNCLAELERGVSVVIGSRHLPGSSFRIREGFVRQFLGEIFRRFATAVLGLRVSDITCGLKGFEREAARRIFSRSRIERWGYDAEILFLARKLGLGIREVPVDWYHSFDSKVTIGSAAVRTLVEIMQIHCNYLFNNRYDL
ncbi:MAG: glycosyltransferase family 2 protein [Deltaproteobacteria bacterium]|nr:glycosyltransferase family 2 protein [Deltaproteobacteria bacterium]